MPWGLPAGEGCSEHIPPVLTPGFSCGLCLHAGGYQSVLAASERAVWPGVSQPRLMSELPPRAGNSHLNPSPRAAWATSQQAVLGT